MVWGQGCKNTLILFFPYFFLKILFIYFLERGEEREKERERNISVREKH